MAEISTANFIRAGLRAEILLAEYIQLQSSGGINTPHPQRSASKTFLVLANCSPAHSSHYFNPFPTAIVSKSHRGSSPVRSVEFLGYRTWTTDRSSTSDLHTPIT